MPTPLLAVRVHPWQAFKLRKLAHERNLPLGMLVTEAIQIFFSFQKITPEKTEAWLAEYQQAKKAG